MSKTESVGPFLTPEQMARRFFERIRTADSLRGVYVGAGCSCPGCTGEPDEISIAELEAQEPCADDDLPEPLKVLIDALMPDDPTPCEKCGSAYHPTALHDELDPADTSREDEPDSVRTVGRETPRGPYA